MKKIFMLILLLTAFLGIGVTYPADVVLNGHTYNPDSFKGYGYTKVFPVPILSDMLLEIDYLLHNGGSEGSGISTLICNGTDKFSGFNSITGQFICSSDQVGSPGSGIINLNGSTQSSQSFVAGTNISVSTNTETGAHTISAPNVETILAHGKYSTATQIKLNQKQNILGKYSCAGASYVRKFDAFKGTWYCATPDGTRDHAVLINLDYAHSGHTGFQPTLSNYSCAGGQYMKKYVGGTWVCAVPTVIGGGSTSNPTHSNSITLIGDSKTTAYLNPEWSYGVPLFHDYSTHYPGTNVRIINNAFNGWNSELIRLNLDTLALSGTDSGIVVLMIGANDSTTSTAYYPTPYPYVPVHTTLVRFEENIRDFVTRVRAAGKFPILMSSLGFWESAPSFNGTYTSNANLAPYNTVTRRVASDTGTDFVDQYLTAQNSTNFQSDGLHPTLAGSTDMFKRLDPVLQRLYGTWDRFKNVLTTDGTHVGVGGVTSPSALLHIGATSTIVSSSLSSGQTALLSAQDTNAAIDLLAADSTSTAGVTSGMRAIRSRGTLASPSAPSSGDSVLGINGAVWTGARTWNGANISFIVDGTVSDSGSAATAASPIRIGLSTRPYGYTWYERLTVKSNGNVGISNVSPSYLLDVAGDVNYTGNLYHNGSLLGLTDWSTSTINGFTTLYPSSGTYIKSPYFGSGIRPNGVATPPAGLTVSGLAYTGSNWSNASWDCKVTAIDGSGTETNQMTTVTAIVGSNPQYPQFTWTALSGAASYRVYCTSSGGSFTNAYYRTSATNSLTDWADRTGSATGQATPPSTYNNIGPLESPAGIKFTSGTLADMPITSITASSPLTGGTITTTGSIGCQTASGSQAGCLSSTDWNTFNQKLSSSDNVDEGSW